MKAKAAADRTSKAQKYKNWLINPTGAKRRELRSLAPVRRSQTPQGLSSSGKLELGNYPKPWSWYATKEAKAHARRLREDSYVPPRPKSVGPSESCAICNGSTQHCSNYHAMLSTTATTNKTMVNFRMLGPFRQSVEWEH
eukprot:TRINITY_DN10031_c0_g1_i1.p1 TRINITY_DN10031_c0_g1~~TRINITY_DN10031_c0_g1_i1.p1  ORF type:complete len:140 (+),score=22.62 TRINITY_DN10031_c0_g1_i1:116-535(+)